MTGLCRVVVMARAPVPGETKRRLIPAIGAERAAALHRAMIHRAVATALASDIGPVELWCTPGPDHEVFRSLERRLPVDPHTQVGPDLGVRMHAAIAARPGAAVVIGTDCPFLESDDLVRAAGALRGVGPEAEPVGAEGAAGPEGGQGSGREAGADVVIVPALDGGYVLIAVRRPRPELFTRIDWGTGRVLAQTRERVRTARLRCVELDARPDVDRPEDLRALDGVLSW